MIKVFLDLRGEDEKLLDKKVGGRDEILLNP